MPPLHVVTGALGYSGRSITERLLARGVRVRTLTNSGGRPNPFGDRIDVRPMNFADRAGLVDSLRGADVLYNTYWVRFHHRLFTFDGAVANSKALFAAAKEAGVGRVVHVSIMNPDADPTLAYYRGKAELERELGRVGIPHAILRPGVLFGRGDILVNNIAWVLRHLPLFGVFGDGRYRVQPMHVDDLAGLAVDRGMGGPDGPVDAKGPETFTFRELVGTIARIIGVRRPIVGVPARVGYAVATLLNPVVGDVVVTWEEVKGLMSGLLANNSPPTGGTKLTEWAAARRESLGVRYASEVGRRVKRDLAYQDA